jgi:hypothetical protein
MADLMNVIWKSDRLLTVFVCLTLHVEWYCFKFLFKESKAQFTAKIVNVTWKYDIFLYEWLHDQNIFRMVIIFVVGQ